MLQKYRKAVFVVTYFFDDEKIFYLVLKRKLHWSGWEFPKGGVDSGESKKSAAKRELEEETGLIPFKMKRFDFHGRYKYKKNPSGRQGFIGQTFSLYSAEVKKKKVKIDNREHTSYKWLGFQDASKKLTFPNQRKSLKIVNDFLTKEMGMQGVEPRTP